MHEDYVEKYLAEEEKHYYISKNRTLATIVVEGWCDDNLYVWGWSVGLADTNSDQNLVVVSALITELVVKNLNV